MFTDGEDNLLRVADPSFVAACQPHTVSRYYNCDIAVANDTEIVNNRTWLTCPTYIGKRIVTVIHTYDTNCQSNIQIQTTEQYFDVYKLNEILLTT